MQASGPGLEREQYGAAVDREDPGPGPIPPAPRCFLDGLPFDQARELEKDSSTHRLSVSATGYETRMLDVVLDEDQSLSVALRQDAAALPTSLPSAVPPPARGVGRRAGDSSPKKPTSKSIDEQSPYKR